MTGADPVFNARHLDFARHHGFEIVACNVRAGNEKGRAESGVGYVKKNLLNGLEFTDFSAKALLAQRVNARERRLLSQCLSLSNQAQSYYEGIAARRFNARSHLRKSWRSPKSMANPPPSRAIEDALAFNAFSIETA